MKRPNVLQVGQGVYRLDLRSKAFANVLGVVSGGKKTLEFNSRAAAERKADEIKSLLAQLGLKKIETFDTVYRADPVELQRQLEPFGKTISEAVNFYVQYLREEKEKHSTHTLGVLMDQWVSEKRTEVERKVLRRRTYQTLVSLSNQYKAQWSTTPVGAITTKEITEWIESRRKPISPHFDHPISQTTKIHLRTYLSQFFRWCKRAHSYPRENPCENIKISRNEDAGRVNYFVPEDAAKLMEFVSKPPYIQLLPLCAISLFSGVRNAEIKRLKWENIDFEDRSIVVERAASKTAGRRVPMQPNLFEWLQWFRKNHPDLPLVNGDTRREKKMHKKALDYWISNGMRHSYASYFLGAKLGTYADLEYAMGNSRQMLEQHYLNFPAKEISLKYWQIRPKAT